MDVSDLTDIKTNTEKHNRDLINQGYSFIDTCNNNDIFDKRKYWESQGLEVRIEGRVFDEADFVIPYNSLKPIFVK